MDNLNAFLLSFSAFRHLSQSLERKEQLQFYVLGFVKVGSLISLVVDHDGSGV